MAIIVCLGLFILFVIIILHAVKYDLEHYEHPVEAYYEGDIVEFVENMSENQKTIGLRGVVAKRWLDELGWVYITIELNSGKEYTFHWTNIKAIKKVKP